MSLLLFQGPAHTLSSPWGLCWLLIPLFVSLFNSSNDDCLYCITYSLIPYHGFDQSFELKYVDPWKQQLGLMALFTLSYLLSNKGLEFPRTFFFSALARKERKKNQEKKAFGNIRHLLFWASRSSLEVFQEGKDDFPKEGKLLSIFHISGM